MNSKVLVVEDSRIFRTYLEGQLGQTGIEVVTAQNIKEARSVIERDTNFLCAVLDYCLPDGQNGEIIDLILEKNIKAVVITAYFDDKKRNEILAKGVLDYIIKDSISSVSYLLSLLNRLRRNKTHKALVVDDSDSTRKHLTNMLQHQYIQSVEAKDGEEAIAILEQDPDITLVVADHNMPRKDGITMTKEIRQNYDQNRLAILGVSGIDSLNVNVTAQFLKAGANDYLKKPFNQEEFHCRVQNILNMKDTSDDLYKLANQDALTGLWNRRYLFDHVNTSENNCNVAMLDIDLFKKINDTYGHEGGDRVLLTIGGIISFCFQDDLAARFGGEEFCIVNYGDYDKFVQRLEILRQRIEKTTIPYNSNEIRVSISIGSTKIKRDIDTMIRYADERLYKAKQNGRNQLISA